MFLRIKNNVVRVALLVGSVLFACGSALAQDVHYIFMPGTDFSKFHSYKRLGAQDPSMMDNVGMQATLDSRPIHRVYVDGFWMDATDATNEEFAKFVKATRYVTLHAEGRRTFPGLRRKTL